MSNDIAINDYPQLELTQNEISWLKEIWKFTSETGKIPEYKAIRLKTLNELTKDFVPIKINPVLVGENATEIRLLGVLHVIDKKEEFLSNANRIINDVKGKLIADPDCKDFSTSKIGNDLALTEKYVRVTLQLLSEYCTLWSSAGSNSQEKQFGWNTFTVNDPQLDFYLNFVDVTTTLKDYFANQKKRSETFQMHRPIRNIVGSISDFVDYDRLCELKSLSKKQFDLSKLIRLCEELNSNYDSKNYYSIAILTRAIIDHIPPVFGLKTFAEIANNYKSENNERSFKKQMNNLNNSLRNVGDSLIHSQIRNSEVLPNMTQVDFKSDLDVLLGEIVRILR